MPDARSAEISINQNHYQVEIADSVEKRRLGLMHRQKLEDNHGMLLVYPNNGDHRIWMKNMLIPLTVIWINNQFSVVEIKKILPCAAPPCEIYSSPFASRFVLELNDGNHPIRIGDRVRGLSDLIE
ncbi:MAG: DUF192 domain-containing protein [Pseudomonadota bacterium]